MSHQRGAKSFFYWKSKGFRKARNALAWLLVLNACALQNGSFTKQCILPQDQNQTLNGKWTVAPIPLALHAASQFDSREISLIQAAVATWNQFGMASYGKPIFDLGNTSSPRFSTQMAGLSCSNSIINSGAYTSPVVIYKSSPWSNGYPSNAIAITSRCPGSTNSNTATGGQIASYVNAQIELNYQEFFVAGKPLPDLQSILLHELGHLAGLNHSCEVNAAAGIPGCGTGGLPQDYKLASLFPNFTRDSSSGTYEQRRALNWNDQGRTNCLYQTGSVAAATSVSSRR